MTPDEINKAIAESVGWKWFDHPDVRERTKTFTMHDKWIQTPSGELVFPHSVTNYHGDLNACAEFEKTLTQGSAKQIIHATNRYTNELCKLLNCLDTALFQFTTATAPQRCEAYLRTIGKWRDQ